MSEKAPWGLEVALLGFLQHGPTHAYEMHQQLGQAESLGLVWQIKQSHLYALLTRLEESGYLSSTMEAQGARPPRKMLALTPWGQTAFEQWLQEPVTHGRDFRQEFLAKLFFATQMGNQAAATLIEHQRLACLNWLAALQRQTAEPSDEPLYTRMVLGFRRSQIEAIINWLNSCAVLLIATTPAKDPFSDM